MKTRLTVPPTCPQITSSALGPRDDGDGAERNPLSCRVTYSYQGGGDSKYYTEGLTREISETGCVIHGIVIPPVASQTRLMLHLDRNLRLSLNATITWVDEDLFGVRFSEVKRKDYVRLRQYISNAMKRPAA